MEFKLSFLIQIKYLQTQMNILAIEQSTSLCSMVLSRDGRLLAEREWEDSWSRNQHFFSLLPGMLREASISPTEIDIFSTGLGPGSFSGLRCALAAMNGLSLSGQKRVYGISSAEILAWQVMRATGYTSIMIIGDARRDYAWYSCYKMQDKMPSIQRPISLVAADKLASVIMDCECVSTPDWIRMCEKLKKIVPEKINPIQGRQTPKAKTLAELTIIRTDQNRPSEPLTPIYLHPPVATRK